MGEHEVLGSLWVGHLSSSQQHLVRRGVEALMERVDREDYKMDEEDAEDGLDDDWRLKAALARGRRNLPIIPSHKSEQEVMTGYAQDGLEIAFTYRCGLFLTTAEKIPPRGKVISIRGIMEQACMAQTVEEERYTWMMPGDSEFVVSQRDPAYANVLRYLNSSYRSSHHANTVIEWESVWDAPPFCPGVGVLCAPRGVQPGSPLLASYQWAPPTR